MHKQRFLKVITNDSLKSKLANCCGQPVECLSLILWILLIKRHLQSLQSPHSQISSNKWHCPQATTRNSNTCNHNTPQQLPLSNAYNTSWLIYSPSNSKQRRDACMIVWLHLQYVMTGVSKPKSLLPYCTDYMPQCWVFSVCWCFSNLLFTAETRIYCTRSTSSANKMVLLNHQYLLR